MMNMKPVKWQKREAQDHFNVHADGGAVTDEDSGEEDHVDVSTLPSTQLTVFASIKSSQLQDDTDKGVTRQENRRR